MGCLALDNGEAEIRLGSDDRPVVSWRETSAQTEARWNAAINVMRRIYDALGGEMHLDSHRREGTVSTAHPLRGCQMSEADDALNGVAGPFGESFRNRDSFVVDSAIIPSALGVNPSLTIAAVAEAIADRTIPGEGPESFTDRLR